MRCLIPCSELDFEGDLIFYKAQNFRRDLILFRDLIFCKDFFRFFIHIHLFPFRDKLLFAAP